MTYRKYSKPSDFYIGLNEDFFARNKELLKYSKKINSLYLQQPIRLNCKLCEALLDGVDFSSHGIDYTFCKKCGHFNGRHDDTEEFVSKVYLENIEYSKKYTTSNFDYRIESIYKPKLDFLLQNIPLEGSVRILDAGCGAGFFVGACLQKNLVARGIDFSLDAVDYGNTCITDRGYPKALKLVDETSFYTEIADADVNVLVAIGVIEHLRDPQKFFDSFMASKARFLFYSVPMFSPSAIFESIFENIYPRNLGLDHTHLFTEDSIAYMHKINQLESVAEWRFGTDYMDLYRSLSLMLKENGCSDYMLNYFNKNFLSHVDASQVALDLGHFCSEIHVVVSKK